MDNHYIAPENKVYQRIGDDSGNYATELWLGCKDSIDNYELIDKPIPIEPVDEELEKAKEVKCAEISNACETTIINGIDVHDEHFSLTQNDQINLSVLYEQAKQGIEPLLYHADGELCRQFTAEEITTLMTKATEFKIYHTTYCNHLFAWINRCETVEEVQAITYGINLPEDLQNHMNEVLGIETTD